MGIDNKYITIKLITMTIINKLTRIDIVLPIIFITYELIFLMIIM